MLWSERRRLAKLAEREALGEKLWRSDIPHEARVKIAEMWVNLRNELLGYHVSFNDKLRGLLIRELGKQDPSPEPYDWINESDTDYSLSVLEAVHSTVKDARADYAPIVEGWVNNVFNSHRVAYRMIDGQFVPFESDELHTEVIEPTLRLLVDDRFTDAHAAYLKALKEISADDAADAITDACTALQLTLETLGCEGNALGPLIKSARKSGLLAAHDQQLADGIEKMLHWASADRSQLGDGHRNSQALRDDAWLTVHVVGALIVRLAGRDARSG